MKIFIKNMVCNRCKMVVKSELEKLDIHPLSVELGEVELTEQLTDEKKSLLNDKLIPFGFVIIDDKKVMIIEKVK